MSFDFTLANMSESIVNTEILSSSSGLTAPEPLSRAAPESPSASAASSPVSSLAPSPVIMLVRS